KDRSTIDVLLKDSAVRDAQGNILHSRSIWRDVTERKQAEEQLEKARDDYRAITNLTGDIIVRVDAEGRWTFLNDGACEFWGRPREGLIGIRFADYLHPDDQQETMAAVEEVMSGKSVVGLVNRQKTPQGWRIVQWNAAPIFENGRYMGFQATGRDITERKQAEEALGKSEEKYRSLVKNVKLGIFRSTPEPFGKFLEVNPAMEGITGYSRDELLRMSVSDLYVRPEEREAVLEEVATVVEKATRELNFRKKDGTEIVVSDTKVAVRDDTGKVLYFDGIIEDITERKQAEAERWELEQRAQLASRLSTVGEMASGIAHEINNPLTAVIGFAQLLVRKDIPEDIKEEAKIINDSAQRVASIVKRLLAFARQQKLERVYADINDIIESTLGMRAYAMATSNIQVVTHLDPNLPRTMAAASQMQQVFLNIIVNAETEMKLAHGRGKLLVRTETVDNIIRISFKDDGPGIAKENLGRIFDPFFTTRKVGEGTGLGLSICHAIVVEHNGQLHVKSKLGKGAIFIVELPIIAEEKQLGLPEPAPDDSIKIGRAKILVVDDEPATLELLSQILTAEGHEVQTTEKATDALKRIKSERYSLILLDIKLPGMSGVELYQSIEKIA
ncbi:MAG: PAS domain S-box protein, partial [Dehalococcoidia bacterium]